jgi:hypothetical protein
VEVIDSGRTVRDDIAVNEVVVSAETLDSRKGGGCLPISKELAVDAASPGCSSSSSGLDGVRFRFVRTVEDSAFVFDDVGFDDDSGAFDFGFVLDLTLVSLGIVGESWILNMYTESADHDPTNSFGLASENLQAVICTLRRDIAALPWGENRRTHYYQMCPHE